MTTEIAPSRPNFFILLELDPNASWDQEKFENIIRTKRNEWSRQSSSIGPKALIAKRNLDLIPMMNKVMLDEESRKQEAKDARVSLNAERGALRDTFERQLALINAATSIEEEALNNFIKAFKDILSPEEIRARIKVQVRSGSKDAAASRQLDPTKAKKIAELLTVVKRKTLYNALQLAESTDTATLFKAAEGLYNQVVHQVPKTATVNAITELAGLAMEVFKTEEMRLRYDESLRAAGLDHLLKDVDDFMNHSMQKTMTPEQVTLFLENAEKSNWPREEALQKLQEHGLQHRWTVEHPEASVLVSNVKCGNCGRFNSPTDRICTNCRHELYIDCPGCGQRVVSSQRSCGNCGFDVGNHRFVDEKLDTIQRMIKVGDLKKLGDFSETIKSQPEVGQKLLEVVKSLPAARNGLVEAEQAWHPEKPDVRTRRIYALKEQVDAIERMQQEVQRSVTEQLEHLAAQRQFYAARELLDKQGEFVPAQEKVEKKLLIEAKIAEAQSLMKQARVPNLSPDEQVSKVRKVLKVCADSQEALDMLKKLPISPPTHLRAHVGATSISLSWNASTTPEIDYTIVRSTNKRPSTAKDGKVLGNVSRSNFEDTTPVIGRSLYYAVFAGFDTAPSEQAAVLAQPVFLAQDVVAATALASNQTIQLSWQTPSNIHSVVVVRKTQSPPTSLHDGYRVGEYNGSQQQVVDTNLQNGQMYYYGIYAQYMNHESRLVPSGGKIVSAIPEDPPVPLHHLEIKSKKKKDDDFEITISWNYSGKGDTAILKSDKPFPSQVKDVLPEIELSNYGQVLPAGPDPEAVADIWEKTSVIVYYTPVVIFQQMAYIGSSQQFINMDVRVQNIGTAVRFQWRWPDNCQEVLLTYKTDSWPSGHDDSSATTRKVLREQYENNMGGHYDLRGARDQDYYILLTPTIIENGKPIAVESIRVETAQKIHQVLTYKIEKRWGKRQVHITASVSTIIPRLQLIGRHGKPAMRKNDGDMLETIGPIALLGKREQPVPLTGNYAPGTYGTLFLDDDTMIDEVIIRHPSPDKLRLS